MIYIKWTPIMKDLTSNKIFEWPWIRAAPVVTMTFVSTIISVLIDRKGRWNETDVQ